MAKLNKCVICYKVIDKKFEPFCSERCKEIDLGKWMLGAYTITDEKNEFSVIEKSKDVSD